MGLSSCSPQHVGITEPNLNFPRATHPKPLKGQTAVTHITLENVIHVVLKESPKSRGRN